jgi:hypothetical protein
MRKFHILQLETMLKIKWYSLGNSKIYFNNLKKLPEFVFFKRRGRLKRAAYEVSPFISCLFFIALGINI